MSEYELLALWSKARLHVILAQLGPIVLLILTVWLLASGLGATDVSIRLAATGILLAAGILGSLAEFSAANEAQAIAADLAALPAAGLVSKRIVASARWADVVKFVTPAIFVLVFVALLWALFIAPHV